MGVTVSEVLTVQVERLLPQLRAVPSKKSGRQAASRQEPHRQGTDRSITTRGPKQSVYRTIRYHGHLNSVIS